MRRKYEFVFRDYNTGRVLGTLALDGKFADALANRFGIHCLLGSEGRVTYFPLVISYRRIK
jgi:lysophospholipid acyltransferase (LPLAT)-like uncharacterized protein